MARGLSRGQIWMYRFRLPDKRRPVLILSRNEAIAWLNTVTVAPVTSTIHGIPSEVRIGQAEGLKWESAVNLDHIQTVEQVRLEQFRGSLTEAQMKPVCDALAVALGCD
ncbi:MAG: type II toxin-antitoxin system PemK/MazF family toxin [Candidatus Thiosymbion ectosymbiont of Robbea hypermnestra]|nr:type II toxin-antitoxin system PemK/MazF family toxin [Candidatus Thiosymbion ectosymbiont of Robbea hypermnestra]